MLSEGVDADMEDSWWVLDRWRDSCQQQMRFGSQMHCFYFMGVCCLFVSLGLSAELCLLSSLCSVCCVFFLYPDLEQGSWVQLMMMKDTWKRQSGAKPGFRSSILVDQPCAATSSHLRGASQTGPGNHLVKGSTSRHGNCRQLQDELQQDWDTARMLLFICCNDCTNGAAFLFLACFSNSR